MSHYRCIHQQSPLLTTACTASLNLSRTQHDAPSLLDYSIARPVSYSSAASSCLLQHFFHSKSTRALKYFCCFRNLLHLFISPYSLPDKSRPTLQSQCSQYSFIILCFINHCLLHLLPMHHKLLGLHLAIDHHNNRSP